MSPATLRLRAQASDRKPSILRFWRHGGIGVTQNDISPILDQEILPPNGVFVENHGGGNVLIRAGDQLRPLSRFLAYCANSLDVEPKIEDEYCWDKFHRARDLFVRAGLEALAAQPTEDTWLQIGIRSPQHLALRRELCTQIAGTARRLLSDSLVDNFFYMNKAPGMRLRFERAEGSSYDFEETLYKEVAHWRAEGLVEGVEPGVYEPESQLFGGPTSMRYVHALFTVDSLIWLDYHSSPLSKREDNSAAWLVSLAMLQAVFDGLDINGWEDLGVWDQIRKTTGRHLEKDAIALSTYLEVSTKIRAVWSRRDQLIDQLHPTMRSIVAHHGQALRAAAAQWRSGYFSTRDSYLGPRAAAAFYVVFHWNRAGLSAVQQAVLAESLAQGEV